MTGNSHVTIGVMTYAALWAYPLGPVTYPLGSTVYAIGPLGVPLLADTRSLLALPLALMLVALGALLPDVDHPEGRLVNSRLFGIEFFRVLPWLLTLIAAIYKVLTIPITLIFKLAGVRLHNTGFRANFGHRGITHSLLTLAVVVALGELPFFPWSWLHPGLLIGWGYASHLLADSLTKSGIPLFWPLEQRFGFPPFRILRFTTDTWPEYLIVAILTVICVANATRAFLG